MRDSLVEPRVGRRSLFDLPDAPRPSPDVPAPPRFLPEFDNLVLAHTDRSRVLGDLPAGALTTKNLRVRAAFLCGGYVAGTWSVVRKGKAAALDVSPSGAPVRDVEELVAEGEASTYEVRLP